MIVKQPAAVKRTVKRVSERHRGVKFAKTLLDAGSTENAICVRSTAREIWKKKRQPL